MEQQHTMQPIAAVPEIAGHPRPLRVVRGPNGRRHVMRRGLAALAALQAGIPKVLRLGVIQGQRIVEERVMRTRETVTVGPSERSHFVVAHPTLAGRHPLFELRPGPKGEQYFLDFTEDMVGRVAFPAADGGVMDLDALKASGRAVRGPRGWLVPLTDQCRGKLVVGDTTLLFQFVTPPPVQPRPQLPASVRGGWLDRVEPAFVAAVGLSALVHVGLMCFAMLPEWPKPTLEEIIADTPVQFIQVPVAPLEADPPGDVPDAKTDPATQGAGDRPGAETSAKPDAPAAGPVEPGKPDPQSGGPGATRSPDPATVRVGDESLTARQLEGIKGDLVNTFDVQDLLSAPGDGPVVAIGSPFGGHGASVTQLDQAMQNANGVGDGSGANGTYTTLADLGPGPAAGPLGPNGSDPPPTTVVPPRDPVQPDQPGPVVTSGTIRVRDIERSGPGVWSGNVFQAKLGAKRRAIEACYNAALVRDPTLAGELTFLVTVNPQGTVDLTIEVDSQTLRAAGVTDCIAGKLRSLNFTANPPQGGAVHARVPFSFVAP
jgi:hypothetical protein